MSNGEASETGPWSVAPTLLRDWKTFVATELGIAFDMSFTHMYALGTRRYVRSALQAGATPAEVMAVLKLCVAHGVQARNPAIPLLAQELAA